MNDSRLISMADTGNVSSKADITSGCRTPNVPKVISFGPIIRAHLPFKNVESEAVLSWKILANKHNITSLVVF